MNNFFKNIGRGIGYFFLFPTLLIAIALYAVFGLIVFIYQFFKLIFLFFTGRTLFSDLPEDIKLKALLDEKQKESKPEESVAQPEPEQSSTQTAPVYGGNYASLYIEANPKPEETEEPEGVMPKIEPEPEEGGDGNND